MATILVTGGAGYIGSHTCKALARAGHLPVAYDSLVTGHRELVKWGPLEVGELHDRARLDAVLAAYRPDAVMHFASLICVDESVSRPDLYEHNIVGGARSLLSAMAAAKVETIVASSSCAVYGAPRTVPITENEPCKPINPYGRAKLRMEQLLAETQEQNDLSWVALRYFNAAGADPEGETGEWHQPETHLIPRLLDVAAGRAASFTIHGVDYPTADGTCVRDYIHVCDLADAHILALRYALAQGGGRSFNLGTGNGASVREVIDTVRKITCNDVPVVVGPRRTGDPPMLVADVCLARNILGWSARRSDIATQVADAWAWHRKRLG